jgi:hypothetical protein
LILKETGMEITDELVSRITAELWRRLGPESGPAAARPRLLVVGDPAALSPAARDEILKYFEVLENPAPGLPFMRRQEDENLKYFEGLENPADCGASFTADSVLVTSLSLQALVRVAAGEEGCTPEGRALLAALLQGRPAAVLKSGLIWRRCQGAAPRPLLDRYVRCEDLLVSYGVKLVDEAEIISALLGRSAGRVRPVSAPAVSGRPSGRRRVLTEAEVRAACPVAGGSGQTLRLGPGDFLTPLARDYVQSLKLNLSRG